jgi:hypothetical protein
MGIEVELRGKSSSWFPWSHRGEGGLRRNNSWNGWTAGIALSGLVKSVVGSNKGRGRGCGREGGGRM